jgi:hypothetical protein
VIVKIFQGNDAISIAITVAEAEGSEVGIDGSEIETIIGDVAGAIRTIHVA